MSEGPTGLALALLSMVLFGLYMVPRKLSGLRDFGFVLSMAVGSEIVCAAGTVLLGTGHLTDAGLWSAAACGPLWSVGMIAYALAVTEMGLALATPIKNTTAVWGTLLGILAFGEGRHTATIPCVLGSLLVVASAGAFSRASGRGGSLSARGVLFALVASLGFAAYTAPLKLALGTGISTPALVLVMGAGVLICAAGSVVCTDGSLRAWRRHPWSDHGFALLAGTLWALATLVMSAAIRRIGLAITWPAANLNTLVTVAAGIWGFHEIDPRRHARPLIAGALLGVAGVVLLGLAHR